MYFNNKPLLAHIKSALIWAATGYVIAAVATFAHIALLSRNLSLSDFGVFILLNSFAILFSTLAGLGLPEAIVKFVAKYQRTDSAFASSTIRTALIATVLSTTFLSLAVLMTGKSLLFPAFKITWDPIHLALLCCWFFLLTVQAILAAVFRSTHDIKKSTFFGNTFRNILYFLLTLIAVSIDDNFKLSTALSIVVVSTLINNLFSSLLIYKLSLAPPLLQRSNTSKKVESIFSVSFPLLGNLITQLIFARVGVWALGYYSTKDTVAIYGAAVHFSTLIGMTLLIINSMSMPLIADMYHNEKRDKLQHVLRTTTTLIAIPIICLYIFLIIFGDKLLTFVFGDAYGAGYWILIMLATGQLGNLLAGPCGLVLKMTGHHFLLLKINYCFVVIMAPLTLLFASQYGAHGVAFVAMLSFIFQNIVSLHYSSSRAGIYSAAFLRPSQVTPVVRSLRASQQT